MKKYSKTTITKKSLNGKQIPNTGFAAGEESEKYVSKNMPASPMSGRKVTTLRYKLGEAIADSQDNIYGIFIVNGKFEKGDTEDRKVVLGCFPGGSKNPNGEYFAYDTANDVWHSTNMYSHYLPMMIIAYSRFNGDKELNRFFPMLDFGKDGKGIIDKNQEMPFFMVNSSLECQFNELVIGKNFIEYNETADFIEMTDNLDLSIKDIQDITGFVRNSYKAEEVKNIMASRTLGIRPEMVTYVPVPEMESESVPVTKDKQLEMLQKKYYNGIHMMPVESLKELPLLLQTGYQDAQQAFLQNRDFFTLQDYQLIDGIALGYVHSVNFTGPAGTGKTTLARNIAGALGLPFVLVGGSANIEESDLLGTRGIEEHNGASVTTWTDGPITTAIRYGGLLLFDEVNAADPGILMKLNTILDGSKSMMLSTAEKVDVNPNFVYFEAMNVGSGYVGTDQMNQSHFDRCDEMYKVAPKSPEEEAKIIEKVTGYHNLDVLVRMAKIKSFILDQIKMDGDEAEQICSIRRLIAWVNKARRTGEFVESSLSTVIAHLSVYDDSIATLSIQDVQMSSGISATVLSRIQEEFSLDLVDVNDFEK